MRNKKRASTAGTVKGSQVTERPVRYIAHSYCITFLLAISTVIAGWNISNVWNGIVTMVIGTITVVMVDDLIKEESNGKR